MSFITLRLPSDLSLEVFEQVVWHGTRLALDPELLQSLDLAREAMTAVLGGGAGVYGVTTGMGYLAGVPLSQEEQQHHQANLLLGRAVGGPPWLDRHETRAVLLARLAGFLQGHAGVTPQLCQFLIDRLNDDFLPAIPRSSIGCAGEIIPLAHAFQTFLGIGEVLGPDGMAVAAGEALSERRVAPYRPASKEGIALLAGAPGVLALAATRRRSSRHLAQQLLVAAACAIDALGAPLAPYDAAVAGLAVDPLMARVLGQLGTLLTGSRAERSLVQAPVSFRVIPQVLTYLHRVVDRLEASVRRALAADTDSPAFVDGHFITSGGFHAIELAAEMDCLSVALVHAAELAGQHIHRLLDHRFSGLPDQLAPHPGPNAGLVVVHKRVVGAISELRRLAVPSTVGLIDTSLGQEDAMTFGFEAAETLRRVELLVREVIACGLLTTRQAWSLRSLPVAVGLQPTFDQLCAQIEPVDHDRPLGKEIASLTTALASGAFQG